VTGQLVAASALVVAALCVGGWPVRPARARLARSVPAAGHERRKTRPALDRRRLARLTAALAGLAVAVLAGGWLGVGIGVLLAAALPSCLDRLEPASARRRREEMTAALPFAADLLAATLASGAPVSRALQAVADAVGDPLGPVFAQVGRSVGLGAPPAEAWAPLAAVPGAEPLSRAAARAAESGAALAGACGRLAAELRAGRAASTEATARRAEVLVVLPLGCCFLPAFVLVGIVPVVLGVLDGVLR
jgi:Flp pilus assembly protein TadB